MSPLSIKEQQAIELSWKGGSCYLGAKKSKKRNQGNYKAEVRGLDVAGRIKDRLALEVFDVVALIAFDSSSKVFVIALSREETSNREERW
jgi:hypothetical protein